MSVFAYASPNPSSFSITRSAPPRYSASRPRPPPYKPSPATSLASHPVTTSSSSNAPSSIHLNQITTPPPVYSHSPATEPPSPSTSSTPISPISTSLDLQLMPTPSPSQPLRTKLLRTCPSISYSQPPSHPPPSYTPQALPTLLTISTSTNPPSPSRRYPTLSSSIPLTSSSTSNISTLYEAEYHSAPHSSVDSQSYARRKRELREDEREGRGGDWCCGCFYVGPRSEELSAYAYYIF
ncbi:hypothetical protein BGZ60DRAFT_530125 [Tricladium varicosporioides]|nr:hypothetical protein BGZ60DRAFT_530125 [Hymenoscyphus varicosporioides]